MRIIVWAAIGLGILLPALETIRRGFDHWSMNFTTMFEDYLAGVGLLVTPVGALLGARWATPALVVMWSGTTFMLLISTVSQVEHHFWSADPEPRSGVVLIIKLLLFVVSLVALVQSLREFQRAPRLA
jgi:NADH:ubiquinone oxidoreductase subunit 6 (subunit J)